MKQQKLHFPFLDINIIINKDSKTNIIWMDIFYKKNDTRRSVSLNSCHPKQCRINTPFTLARPICTIVENSDVTTRFKRNKYPHLKFKGLKS